MLVIPGEFSSHTRDPYYPQLNGSSCLLFSHPTPVIAACQDTLFLLPLISFTVVIPHSNFSAYPSLGLSHPGWHQFPRSSTVNFSTLMTNSSLLSDADIGLSLLSSFLSSFNLAIPVQPHDPLPAFSTFLIEKTKSDVYDGFVLSAFKSLSKSLLSLEHNPCCHG